MRAWPLDDLRQSLAEMQTGVDRVTTAEQLLVRSTRAKTGLSQQAFADRIKAPVATLRDWEQGWFAQPGSVS